MSELRQDPMTHDWVILSPERARRPHDAGGPCPFCAGAEHLTPESVDRIDGDDGHWLVRAVPNRFAVLSPENVSADGEQVRSGWRRLPGFGRHEVIIETPAHIAPPGGLGAAQTRLVLEMYARRTRALAADSGQLRQIVVFRNHGARAGTSLSHPHSQIVAAPAVSPETRRRVADEIAYFDETGHCALCHVIGRERSVAERVVLETGRFVTIAPYASQNPWQLQIVPLRHCPSFTEATAAELDDLAGHLARVQGAMHDRLGDPDYNLVVSSPPLDLVHRAASHWYIEILPRLTTPAGFELGSRIVVNVQTPERAAAELRERLRAGFQEAVT
jgi:UDPglucose--hexose-1-phosphate uridylyltransferase